MDPSDRHDLTKSILSRAAQYDLQLHGNGAEAVPQVFIWRWHHRTLGPEFPNRDLAIDWMAEWLDADTAAQESPWAALEAREPSDDRGKHIAT